MIKKIAFVLIMIIFSAGALYYLDYDPGFVLINYHHYQFKSTLFGLIILIMILLIVLLILSKLLKFMINLMNLTRGVFKKSNKRSLLLLHKGLLAYLSMHFNLAVKYLKKSAQLAVDPSLQHLMLAYTHQELGDYQAVKEDISASMNASSQLQSTAHIVKVRLDIASNNYEQAFAALQHIPAQYKNESNVLKMKKEVYIHLKEWKLLAGLLPYLKRKKLIDKKEYESLQLNIHKYFFEQQLNAYHTNQNSTIDREQVLAYYKNITAHLKQNPEIITVYVKVLLLLEDFKTAEMVVRQQIIKDYQQVYIKLYRTIQGPQIKEQLKFIESILVKKNNDYQLLITAAVFTIALQQFSKACEYLEMSLSLSASIEAHKLLGILLKKLGYYESGCDHLEKALQLLDQNNE